MKPIVLWYFFFLNFGTSICTYRNYKRPLITSHFGIKVQMLCTINGSSVKSFQVSRSWNSFFSWLFWHFLWFWANNNLRLKDHCKPPISSISWILWLLISYFLIGLMVFLLDTPWPIQTGLGNWCMTTSYGPCNKCKIRQMNVKSGWQRLLFRLGWVRSKICEFINKKLLQIYLLKLKNINLQQYNYWIKLTTFLVFSFTNLISLRYSFEGERRFI